MLPLFASYRNFVALGEAISGKMFKIAQALQRNLSVSVVGLLVKEFAYYIESI